jgi:hypothetical protein
MSAFASGAATAASGDGDGVGKSDLHGYGVFCPPSASTIPGQVVFSEVPALRLQSLPNRGDALVCGCCSRFLGSVGLQLGILSRRLNRVNYEVAQAHPLAEDLVLSDITPCGMMCGELYCSEQCRSLHWDRRHALLCCGCVAEEEATSSPLIAFKEYAVNTNEILLMVADVFAEVFSNPVVAAGGAGGGGEECRAAAAAMIAPFESYVRPLWWEAAIAPDGTDPDELTSSLREIVVTTWEMLNALFGITNRNLQSILSAEFIGRLIGMFEQNNVGIRLPSPVDYYVEHMSCSSRAVDKVLEATNGILAVISEGVYI